MRVWTPEKVRILKVMARAGSSKKDIAKCVGLKENQVRNYMRNYDIKNGRRGPKEPWNRGKKIDNFTPHKGCFKKGFKPKHTVPNGTITMQIRKNGLFYYRIKIDNTWKYIGGENSLNLFLDENPKYRPEYQNRPIPPSKAIFKMVCKYLKQGLSWGQILTKVTT